MASLESKIDELYQVPLDEFVPSRTTLAKTLSGADAKRVKTLQKPTVVPWALNQLYWKGRLAWDRLLKSGEQLRKAQLAALEGRHTELRAASDVHRRAVGEAVKATERLASAAGVHPARDALVRGFQALSLMGERPAPPGRLTETPQPAGFEALAGVRVQKIREVQKVREVREVQKVREVQEVQKVREVQKVLGVQKVREVQKVPREEPTNADRRKEAEARKRAAAAARKHEAEISRAEAELARAKASAATARVALERADSAVAAAQAKLSTLKSEA